MDLRQLRSFLILAEDLHFRRSSLRIGITQPALSQQIAALEKELGVTLFERTKRNVALTSAGRTFAERVRSIMGSLRDAVDETRRLGEVAHQRLRVAYLEYVNLPFIGPLLRRLRETHPEILVERRDMWSAEVLVAVAERTVDVGFALLPVTQPNFATRPVLSGHWVAVLPADHRLAQRQSIPLAAFAKEPLIVADRSVNPPLHDWLVSQCEGAGFSPRVAYATTQSQVGLGLVSEGVGCMLTASFIAREPPEGTVSRAIEGFDSKLVIAAVWRADDRSPALRGFLEALRDVAPRRSPSGAQARGVRAGAVREGKG